MRAHRAFRGARRMPKALFLLDLAFLEFDMLAHSGVVFPDGHLVRHGARVLLGDVEKARIGLAVQADLDSGGLRHGSLLKSKHVRANLVSRLCLSRQSSTAKK